MVEEMIAGLTTPYVHTDTSVPDLISGLLDEVESIMHVDEFPVSTMAAGNSGTCPSPSTPRVWEKCLEFLLPQAELQRVVAKIGLAVLGREVQHQILPVCRMELTRLLVEMVL